MKEDALIEWIKRIRRSMRAVRRHHEQLSHILRGMEFMAEDMANTLKILEEDIKKMDDWDEKICLYILSHPSEDYR